MTLPELYLDANAGVPPDRAVRQALAEDDWVDRLVNPASAHRAGQRAHHLLEQAREQIADLLGCKAERLVFTSGGSEGLTTAFWASSGTTQRNRLYLATTDHPHSLASAELIGRRCSMNVAHYPIDCWGRIADAPAQDSLGKTALISIQSAHSELGSLISAAEVRSLLGSAPEERQGALLHVDACQSLGKAEITEWLEIADMVTFSGHKIGAPAGTGLLYFRSGLALDPLLAGSQEWRRRGGTPNLLGAHLFARAAQARIANRMELQKRWKTWHEQTAWVRSLMQQQLPDVQWFSPENQSERLPQTLFFRIPGLRAHNLVMALDATGIAVSAGTACRSGLVEPNPTLLALGYDPQIAQEAIRVSLDIDTPMHWGTRLVEALAAIRSRVKTASSYTADTA